MTTKRRGYISASRLGQYTAFFSLRAFVFTYTAYRESSAAIVAES